MAIETTVVDEMREHLIEIARWNEQHGYWQPGEAKEIGQALKARVDASDEESILLWRAWLLQEVEFVRQLQAIAREACDRIHASCRGGEQAAA